MSAKDNEAAVAANEAQDDDDVPALEAADETSGFTQEQAAQMAQRLLGGKQPKRYAKAMQKMGLKPEPGVLRVMIKKTSAMAFSIAKPEVYKFPGTNTFVIFGEAQVEEASSDQQKAARTVTQPAAEAAPAAKADEDDDVEEDAGDIADKEIEIVMSQASVSRGKAIRALKNNKGDIVNAIMELTM